MSSRALSATILVAASMLCSCAGFVQGIREHNERIAARREAQRLVAENQRASSIDLQELPREQATTGPHAPYAGKVTVALFVTFRGELWQEGMQARAAEMLREDLAAHAQFDLVPEARMQKLGKLDQPQMDSSTWVGRVRDALGKDGPQILLHVTLTSEESIGMNKASGKVQEYPRFTARTSYRHVQRDAAATFSKDGHLFTNGTVMNEVVGEFHDRALTEIMPAQ